MREEIINVDNPNEYEIIIGQGNFSIFAVDDLYRTLFAAVPKMDFAVAMNEAKPQLTRVNGNNEELKKLAAETCLKIGAGHVFVVYMKGAYPIHVLKALKSHPCVAGIYVATSNPLQVIIKETELGRSVVGVVDGKKATKIETDEQKKERRGMLEKFGFVVR